MSADSAPALVQSPDDLVMYHITDSSPVQPTAKKSYQERFIHSELYKRFPEVNCVIHSHSEAVLPYTMSGVPLKPVFHITGFLGRSIISSPSCELATWRRGKKVVFVSAVSGDFNSLASNHLCNFPLRAFHASRELEIERIDMLTRYYFLRVGKKLQ